MAEPKSFLADLEDAVSKGTAESCLRALWHATDVLIAGTYSEEQIRAFGEIISRLAEEIELSARIRLANKLAPSNNAPSKVINELAADDSIDHSMRQEKLASLETLGQFLPDGLLDHPRSGEANLGAWLADIQVA